MTAPNAPSDGVDLPAGFRSIDDYMAEVMSDPERAKAIEEVRPVVLRIFNHALCDQITALRLRVAELERLMEDVPETVREDSGDL